MKKHILLVMALFGVLTVGSCNDDEPVVSPIPGEDEEVVIPAPEPINPVLVQTLYFDFGSVGGGTRGSQTESPDENGHYWNNIYNNDGIYAAVNSVFEDFVNSEGTSVGYKLTLNTRFSTNGGSGGGGLLTPDAELLKDFAVSTATEDYFYIGEFYQFNLSSCIRQQNSLTAQFVSFSLSNLANIFYPPQFLQ